MTSKRTFQFGTSRQLYLRNKNPRMSTPQKNNPSFEFITPDDTREESDTVPQPFSPSVPIQRRAKAPSVMSTFEGEV